MSEDRSGTLDWLSRRLNLTEIFSFLTSFGLFYAELDSRKRLRQALGEVLERPTASYARWPRVLGLVGVVLIVVEVVTGGLLALYYLPTPQAAHASLGTILRDVQFGWFIHQVHFWGAQALLALLALRIARFFLQRVYKAPRELLWVFGVLLLLVCLQLDLTGRALPFTASAYWSTIRSLEVLGAVPLYGSLIRFLLGGDGGVISDLTLIRAYVLHVGVLPAVLIALIYLQFSTVRRVGLTDVEGEEKVVGAVLRTHVTDLAILLALLLGFVVTLAVLVPVPFGGQADPYTTLPGVGPPWYLLAPFGLLELTPQAIPRQIPGAILLLATVAFLALPFLHSRDPGSSPRGRRLMLGGGVLVLVVWFLLSLYGARVV